MYACKRALLILLISSLAFTQNNYPPNINADETVTFKKTIQTDLNLWIFYPDNHKKNDKAASIVFFFGGGWNGGNPAQFLQQAKYLQQRGMVSILADYRVKSRNNTQAIYCLKDAKSAIRWVRTNARKIGIDPNRIVASGGSAGGHLAAATGTIPIHDEEGENLKISSVPNAMILFNPGLILAPIKEFDISNSWPANRTSNLKDRIGVEPKSFSPYHFVNENTPPTIIFHGTKDKTIPHESVEFFDLRMKKFNNKSNLYLYDGEEHGFFNYGRKNQGPFNDTMSKAEKFLKDLGYIN